VSTGWIKCNCAVVNIVQKVLNKKIIRIQNDYIKIFNFQAVVRSDRAVYHQVIGSV